MVAAGFVVVDADVVFGAFGYQDADPWPRNLLATVFHQCHIRSSFAQHSLQSRRLLHMIRQLSCRVVS